MAELVLALVPAKLIKNWLVKYAKFLNTNGPKLNLKVYIKYKSAILNKKIGISKGKKIIILKQIQPNTNLSRYLIITLSISYKNNVLYYFSTCEIDFIIMYRKKRREFCSKLIIQDIWGNISTLRRKEKKQKEYLYISAIVLLILRQRFGLWVKFCDPHLFET